MSTLPADRSSSRRRPFGRLTAGVAAVATAITTTVAAASPAAAWTWDSGVDVMGFASCKTVSNAADVTAEQTWVYVEATGETSEQSVNVWQYWEADLHTIPAAGSAVQVFVYCNVPGESPGWRYAETIQVDRPWVGSYVGPYWQSA